MAITNLEQFCERFHAFLGEKPDIRRLIDTGRSYLGELVSHRDWFGGVIRRVLFDPDFNAGQKPGIWPNELTLYRSPDRSYLILCYIWGPYMSDTIHDHGSWGIIGSLFQPVGESKYERRDDGSREGFAELKQISSTVLQPGETTSVLPLNKGIHKMENFTADVAITINVYGPSIRKGYIQFFNPEKNAVTRAYPPKPLREALAIRAAGAFRAPWSGPILGQALEAPLSEPLKRECELALAGLKL